MRPGAKLASPTTVPTISAASGTGQSNDSAQQLRQQQSSSSLISSQATSAAGYRFTNSEAKSKPLQSQTISKGRRSRIQSLGIVNPLFVSDNDSRLINDENDNRQDVLVNNQENVPNLSSFPAPPPPPPPPPPPLPPLSLSTSSLLLQNPIRSHSQCSQPHHRSNSSSSTSSSASSKSLQTLTTNGDSIHSSSINVGPLLNLKSLSPIGSNQRTVITESSGIDSYHHSPSNRSSPKHTSSKYLATISELSQSSVPNHHNHHNNHHNQSQSGHDCVHCSRYHANQHRRSRSSQSSGSGPSPQLTTTTTRPSPTNSPYYRHSSLYSAPRATTVSPSLLYPPSAFSGPTHAPYPPQWYYLLGADSKQFRKHRHSHYHKDCKVCRQIVRQTFERYYLQQQPTPPPTQPQIVAGPYLARSQSMGATTSAARYRNSSGDFSDRVEGNRSTLSTSMDPTGGGGLGGSPYGGYPSYMSMSQFPIPSRRASCGHSCLKYTILFYCSVAVILAICFICYLTKMFGYLQQLPTIDYRHHGPQSQINHRYLNNPYNMGGTLNATSTPPVFNQTTNNNGSSRLEMDVGGRTIPAPSVLQQFGFEIVGVVIACALMFIFALGLIGTFLESVLCLRIFGAILSYLFLLTFGAAFYVIILLVISRVPAKLILSTVSCAAVTITIHASIAIAPFAFADLLFQEKEDEKAENSTYFKYPSVRFLPPSGGGGTSSRKSGRSYFSLPFLGGGYRGSVNHHHSGVHVGPSSFPGGGTGHVPTIHHHQHHRHGTAAAMVAASSGNRRHSRDTGGVTGGVSRSGSTDSSGTNSINSNSSPRTSPINQDNLSSEGLIPPIGANSATAVSTTTVANGTNSNQVRFNDNWM